MIEWIDLEETDSPKDDLRIPRSAGGRDRLFAVAKVAGGVMARSGSVAPTGGRKKERAVVSLPSEREQAESWSYS